MYCSYWGFQQRPFESGPAAEFFFRAPSHQAAMLKLRYAIEHRQGCSLLAGPSGVGKSMLLGLLRAKLDESIAPVAHIVFPKMSTPELLALIADELTGARPDASPRDLGASVRRIRLFLDENARAGRHAMLIVDEAHLLDDPETWEALRLLMNFEYDGRPSLTLVFAGQTTILPMVDRMPQLEERLAVKCLLQTLNEEETADYVKHRLENAGVDREIFRIDALHHFYPMTHGVPRQVNRLADLALLIGFGEEMKTIGASELEAVQRELLVVNGE